MAGGLLHVACAADDRYLPHAAAMLHSVAGRRGALDLHAHVLHPEGLDSTRLDRLAGMLDGLGAGFTAHPIESSRLLGLPDMLGRGITQTMWLRIFLPELMADEPRVLYLDCDVIALDDLGPLWSVDLGDALVGAVANVWEPWNLGHPERLGIDPADYFNSGVLLLNLDAMRASGATQRLLDHAREHAGDLVWPDQDALNVVLGPGHVALHPRWNAMNSVLAFENAVDVFGEDALAEARARPALRHFEGPTVNKPWHLLADPADAALYRQHRTATPWPRYVPAGLGARNLWRWARRGR